MVSRCGSIGSARAIRSTRIACSTTRACAASKVLRAYLTEGEPIGDPDVLARLAHEVGLDDAEVAGVLGSEAHAREVRADEMMARELGITGVPFFVMGGTLGVSGAQLADVLFGALQRAWADHAAPAEQVADGAVCGPDGCA